jgi:dTDP-4-dehydrorhamnose 3,5-epimerase
MNFVRTALPDVVLIEPKIFEDSRGFFLETFQERRFAEAGIPIRLVQINHSRSVRWVLRGLHYQIQKPQGKLIRVVQGEIFDVAVDLRRGSGTFGKWVSARLTSENRRQLWVPPGFGHGFLVESASAEVIYHTTELYAPQFERTILWNDPEIGVKWPLAEGESPILSDKDAQGRRLADAEVYA